MQRRTERSTRFFCLLFFALIVACQKDSGSEEIRIDLTPEATNSAAAPTVILELTEAPPAIPTKETVIVTSTPVPSPPTNTPLVTPSPSATSTPLAQPSESIELTLVSSGFTKPTYLTHAFDDRLFVVEELGAVRVIEDGQLLPEPFLDIQERVGAGALEQGLLSIAFHPDYHSNGRFFVNYTDKAGQTVIARYLVRSDDPNRADPDTEVTIMTVGQPFVNHNGGQINFGPDNLLYVGMGDGGSAGDPGNNGQNASTLLGALLRIDIDNGEPYSVPDNNPYVDDDSKRDEIWAVGLRNPWRFSFDRLNGNLFVADVGQRAWEEINFHPAGAPGGQNYGWNIMEGSHCYSIDGCDQGQFVLPVGEYSHAEGGCSIIGGYVYRGRNYPELYGNYFFGDWCSGNIWSLFHQPDGSWLRTLVNDSNLNISSFGEDADGELYVLDHTYGLVFSLGS